MRSSVRLIASIVFFVSVGTLVLGAGVASAQYPYPPPPPYVPPPVQPYPPPPVQPYPGQPPVAWHGPYCPIVGPIQSVPAPPPFGICSYHGGSADILVPPGMALRVRVFVQVPYWPGTAEVTYMVYAGQSVRTDWLEVYWLPGYPSGYPGPGYPYPPPPYTPPPPYVPPPPYTPPTPVACPNSSAEFESRVGGRSWMWSFLGTQAGFPQWKFFSGTRGQNWSLNYPGVGDFDYWQGHGVRTSIFADEATFNCR